MNEPQVDNIDAASRWNQHGLRLRELGQWSEALESFEKAIGLDPTNTQSWSLKARALDEMNNLTEAIKAYKYALELNPNSASTWNNKGYCFRKQHKYGSALECYREAVRLQPNYAKAWYNMGYVLDKQGNYEDSLVAFNKAVELAPDNDKYVASRNAVEAVWLEFKKVFDFPAKSTSDTTSGTNQGGNSVAQQNTNLSSSTTSSMSITSSQTSHSLPSQETTPPSPRSHTKTVGSATLANSSQSHDSSTNHQSSTSSNTSPTKQRNSIPNKSISNNNTQQHPHANHPSSLHTHSMHNIPTTTTDIRTDHSHQSQQHQGGGRHSLDEVYNHGRSHTVQASLSHHNVQNFLHTSASASTLTDTLAAIDAFTSSQSHPGNASGLGATTPAASNLVNSNIHNPIHNSSSPALVTSNRGRNTKGENRKSEKSEKSNSSSNAFRGRSVERSQSSTTTRFDSSGSNSKQSRSSITSASPAVVNQNNLTTGNSGTSTTNPSVPYAHNQNNNSNTNPNNSHAHHHRINIQPGVDLATDLRERSHSYGELPLDAFFSSSNPEHPALTNHSHNRTSSATLQRPPHSQTSSEHSSAPNANLATSKTETMYPSSTAMKDNNTINSGAVASSSGITPVTSLDPFFPVISALSPDGSDSELDINLGYMSGGYYTTSGGGGYTSSGSQGTVPIIRTSSIQHALDTIHTQILTIKSVKNAEKLESALEDLLAAARVKKEVLVHLALQKEENSNSVNPHQDKCSVCWEQPAEMVCIPCGHLCICENCKAKLRQKKCPICGLAVKNIYKVFK